jgi:cyclophilin family peptidyl-prolyl cis-trans isomerase
MRVCRWILTSFEVGVKFQSFPFLPFRRVLDVSAKSTQPTSQVFEPLESRLLMHAPRPSQIATAYLDDRGQAFFTVTVALDKTTLSRKSATLMSAGVDGVFGTADDARIHTAVGYRRGRLSLRASLALGTQYRVRLNAATIKDVNGLALDGEFKAGKASGNGFAGGNYDVVSTLPAKTRVRFSTDAGFINVGLYRNTPITKSNFIRYANEGAYDNTIIHRSVRFADPGNPPNQSSQQQIDIEQGGGFKLFPKFNSTARVADHGTINNEGTNLNIKGTLAMANAGANTATSEFFFNVKDNPGLDTTPGTYAVFGAVLDAESQNTLNALAALETSLNQQYPLSDGGHYNVPLRSIAAINARQSFSPKDDLIVVQRIAQLFDIAATPNVQAAARTGSAGTLTFNSSPIAPAVTSSPFLVTPTNKNDLLDSDA